MQVIQFIFSNFWTWLGTFLIVLAASRFSLIRVSTYQKVNSPSDDHSTNTAEAE